MDPFRQKLTGETETMGDKKVVRRPGYDFKTVGGLVGLHENKSMERLNWGIKGTPAGETGRSDQS